MKIQVHLWLFKELVLPLLPSVLINLLTPCSKILLVKANRFSASQETHRILWNPKVHYRIHKCPPPVPILSQLDQVHTPTSHFLNIHLNIILQSILGIPSGLFPSDSPHQHHVYASPHPLTCHMPRPSHYSRFYHPHNIRWGVQIS
jgi:hypothetical protein